MILVALLYGTWLAWLTGGIGFFAWMGTDYPFPLFLVLVCIWGLIWAAPVAVLIPQKGDPL